MSAVVLTVDLAVRRLCYADVPVISIGILPVEF
jgi:hypothetical protein